MLNNTYLTTCGPAVETAGDVVTQNEQEPELKKVKVASPLPTTPPSDGLKYDHHLSLIGRAMKDPLMHLCEICTLPVLIYGRMVRGGGSGEGRRKVGVVREEVGVVREEVGVVRGKEGVIRGGGSGEE